MTHRIFAFIALCLLAFGAQAQTLTNGQRATLCTACKSAALDYFLTECGHAR